MTKHVTRRTLVLGGSAMMLAACGTQTGAEKSSGPTSKASGTVRFSFFGSVEEKAVWEKIAHQFSEKSPAVKVEPEHVPSDYFTKIQTAIAGGDAADVILMEDKPTSGYAKKGFFKELDSYLSKDSTFKLGDHYSVLFDDLQHRGKLYGLPQRQTYLPPH